MRTCDRPRVLAASQDVQKRGLPGPTGAHEGGHGLGFGEPTHLVQQHQPLPLFAGELHGILDAMPREGAGGERDAVLGGSGLAVLCAVVIGESGEPVAHAGIGAGHKGCVLEGIRTCGACCIILWRPPVWAVARHLSAQCTPSKSPPPPNTGSYALTLSRALLLYSPANSLATGPVPYDKDSHAPRPFDSGTLFLGKT